MQITEITMHAAATVPHPDVSYANFRIGVTLTATLTEGEDAQDSALMLGRIARERCEVLEREHTTRLTREAAAERERLRQQREVERAARRAEAQTSTDDDDGIPF